MTWYKDWFRDANYSVVYEHRDESEAEQLIELIERTIGHDPTRRVLDLACGSGRHAISFAKRGYKDVTGIDLSPTLLAEAQAAAKEHGVHIRFLERDIREIPPEEFDLVTNLFTSFGYFDQDEENEEVIRTVAEHLSPNGYFVIDFFNSAWVQRTIVPHDERLLPNGTRIVQMRWIEDGRIEKRLLLRNATEAREYIESVRLFDLSDFERMFSKAGLKLIRVFGSYSGSNYDRDSSPRLIMFAQR